MALSPASPAVSFHLARNSRFSPIRTLIFLPLLLILLARDVSAAEQQTLLIRDVPHVRQKPDFCGEACAEMYLRKLNVPLDQNDVFNHSGLNPEAGRGCYTRDLARALSNIGFKTGKVWFEIPARNAQARLDREFAALCTDLSKGVPSIVCMHYDDRQKSSEHFRLVLGYDRQVEEVFYHEPATDEGAYQRMPRAQFLKLWPLKYKADAWTLIRLRLEPGQLSRAHASEGFTDADYAQHILKLSDRLPSGEFSIVIEKPFVVIRDEPIDIVRQRSKNTVRWAVEHLKQDFFQKDPTEILDIWLFRDSNSYEEHTKELFDQAPSTPYGFYSHRHKALVMNIATGGGTLVHEIVHPFIASNFPDCPSWFNEGLASLYEQAAERNGHIIGQTNWRLAGLQKAIRQGTVPSFETLCGTTTREFYDRDKGTNYAQARYLCYYLQERKLLVKYYTEFCKNVSSDPTGYETLKSVVGTDDIAEFQKRWEKFVLELRFEG